MMSHASPQPPSQLEVHGSLSSAAEALLETGALTFLSILAREFEPKRTELLARRVARRKALNDGSASGFLDETKNTREAAWTVSPPPQYLRDRRVELIGPATAAALQDGLDGSARTYIADFRDHTPHGWDDVLAGHVALTNAVHDGQASGDTVLAVMPRDLSEVEEHLIIDGQPLSASLFDFGLFIFHNAKALAANGRGPYVYLPRIEGYREAQFWNTLFVFVQEELDVARGTIRATAQIGSVPGALEMHEILYELREHSAGLCCDHQNYLGDLANFSLANGNGNGSGTHEDASDEYAVACEKLLVQTCHRRRTHALCGMRGSGTNGNGNRQATGPRTNGRPSSEIRAHAESGSDGVQVEALQLVPIALQVYTGLDVTSHQIDRVRQDDRPISAHDLIPSVT